MEFDEMKKIWDSQNNEMLYAINEKALHSRIAAKKERSRHIRNFTELLLIIANGIAGAVIVTAGLSRESGSLFLYILAVWMFLFALYVIMHRVRRSKGDQMFDRSMRGELNHAITMATHQVHLSKLGRWNLLPVVLLVLLSFWESGKSISVMLGLLLFAIISYYAAGWEHNIYVAMERELKRLRDKLESAL